MCQSRFQMYRPKLSSYCIRQLPQGTIDVLLRACIFRLERLGSRSRVLGIEGRLQRLRYTAFIQAFDAVALNDVIGRRPPVFYPVCFSAS